MITCRFHFVPLAASLWLAPLPATAQPFEVSMAECAGAARVFATWIEVPEGWVIGYVPPLEWKKEAIQRARASGTEAPILFVEDIANRSFEYWWEEVYETRDVHALREFYFDCARLARYVGMIAW